MNQIFFCCCVDNKQINHWMNLQTNSKTSPRFCFFLLLVEIEIAKKLYSLLLLLLLLLTWNVNLENSFAFFFVCLVRKSHIGMLLTWSMYTIQTYKLCVLDRWKNRVPCRWCFRNIQFNIILSLLSGGYLFSQIIVVVV